jgi:hypothetical protein
VTEIVRDLEKLAAGSMPGFPRDTCLRARDLIVAQRRRIEELEAPIDAGFADVIARFRAADSAGPEAGSR